MLQSEKRFTLAEVARLVPGRPNTSTVWRWCRRGVRGVKLEYVKFGRRIYTTREAVDRFSESLAAADNAVDLPAEPVAASHRLASSSEILSQHGI